jgi:hypothetical protein
VGEWKDVDAAPTVSNLERFSDVLDQRRSGQKLLNRESPNRNEQRGPQQLELTLEPRATGGDFNVGG